MIGDTSGEVFYLSSLTPHTFEALVRPGKKRKVGHTIQFTDEISFSVDKITEEWRQLTCSHPIQEVLETYGQMPLPPYISYDETKADPYQPIFASKAWSVAAPTASLHFTQDLMDKLVTQGVEIAYTTLHVWLGTFKQVDTTDIKTYDIHSETLEVDISLFARIAAQKLTNKPLLAIGTTVTRTVESLPYLWKILYTDHQATLLSNIDTSTQQSVIDFRNSLTIHISLQEAEIYIHQITFPTSDICQLSSTLFLYPGRPFYVIDQLITNFHLPKSSLLMLVAWYIGYEQMKQIYEHAITEQYRFYSFGDAMWIR